MPSRLHQLQIAYDMLQDRLVLIMHTQDFCEYRFWITRHIAKGLWNILVQLLKADQKNQLQQMQAQKQIENQIKKEKEQHQAAADKYATQMTRRPLGDEPLLLFKIMAKPDEQGHFLLHLEDPQGRSLEFGGDSTIILALCQLMKQTITHTDWDLPLETSDPKKEKFHESDLD